MTQPKEEKRDHLLPALLQEYANASQLYTNTIAVTYTRFFGFLAVHGALIVGFFLAAVAASSFNFRFHFSNFYVANY